MSSSLQTALFPTTITQLLFYGCWNSKKFQAFSLVVMDVSSGKHGKELKLENRSIESNSWVILPSLPESLLSYQLNEVITLVYNVFLSALQIRKINILLHRPGSTYSQNLSFKFSTECNAQDNSWSYGLGKPYNTIVSRSTGVKQAKATAC